MIFNLLLLIHILSGSTSMSCSLAAIATKKGSAQHKRYGRYFFYGMTGVFITAIPMSLIKKNLFLFLIALFSYYLVYSGKRYARRHDNIIPISDWIVCFSMIAASLIMVALGIWNFNVHDSQSIVLIVFGLLGMSFSLNDARLYYKKSISNSIRITRHLGAMLGGTIAAYTAFLVTNINFSQPIFLWLGPTIVGTPIIIYWTRKVENKKGLFGIK